MIWDDIADAYLSIAEDRDRIISPALLRILDERRASSVVDIGGGDGRFLELLWRHGGEARLSALALTDTSSRMRERARARLSGIPAVTVTPTPADLPHGCWELALLIAVWMGLETEVECVSLLKEAKALLAPDGRLVAAVTHPCFRDRVFHSYSTSFDMRDYLRSGKRFKVNLYDSTRSLAISDTHWSLTDHARQLATAGLAIESLVELPDIENSPEGAPWLLMVARCTR